MRNNEKVMIKKFPGHTAVEMKVCVKGLIPLHKPDKIIVITGTNDLSYEYRKEQYTPEDIAEKIMAVARVGVDYGVPVVLSSLFVRHNRRLNNCTKDINEILESKCKEEGISMMKQDNIFRKDLWDDKLHLGDNGLETLRKNLLRQFRPDKMEENNKRRYQESVTDRRQTGSLRFEANNPCTVENSPDETGRTVKPIVPGEKTYKEAVINRKPAKRVTIIDNNARMESTARNKIKTNDVRIVSSSVAKSVDLEYINRNYSQQGRVHLHPFPGRKATSITKYVDDILEEDDQIPSKIILLAGGNDLERFNVTSTEEVSNIANSVIRDAIRWKTLYGVPDIYIGGILPRSDCSFQASRYELNELLKTMCEENGLKFMANDNFYIKRHVGYDGVHLNDKGTQLLEHNILICVNDDGT